MDNKLPKTFYAGLFLLSVCLLASQFLLVRMLSVVFWHHFVFYIISVTMFGLTAGTLIVYFAAKVFTAERTKKLIVRFSLIAAAGLFISQLSIFYLPAVFHYSKFSHMAMINSQFLLLSVPFMAWGICLSLILTRFPDNINKLYSVNLAGSAVGCLVAYFLLNSFRGPSVGMILTAICLFSGLLFSFSVDGKINFFRLSCVVTMIVILFFSFKNERVNAIWPQWVKGSIKRKPPFDSHWNFFSYITLREPARKPFGWGFSPKVQAMDISTEEGMIQIDEDAGTVLTQFKDLADLEYLKYDISAFAHHVRHSDSVLVIGSGGGRDLLTAVTFGAKKVVGVEINESILEMAFLKYHYFSKSIFDYPAIKMFNDDGRCYVSRTPEKFDLIQASLVDSFAAATTGAFALTENSLYTREAWGIYLDHLTDHGILTFSRWYHKTPLEIYRLLTLAKSSLKDIGIEDPRRHLVLVRFDAYPDRELGVGTILVSKSPFTVAELDSLRREAGDLQFEISLSPEISTDENFDIILNDKSGTYELKNTLADVSPPTDDRPFFFYYSYFADLFRKDPIGDGPVILIELAKYIITFGALFLLFPFMISPRKRGLAMPSIRNAVYFASIGMGFMFLEMALIQRLGLFLGHPVYGLMVVLFSLLLACGAGSYFSKYIKSVRRIRGVFMVLLFWILLLCGLLPIVCGVLTAMPIQIKIIVSIISIVPVGFLMGMPFPLALSLAGKDPNSPLILYWGVNGFASMSGSILATIALINFGYQSTIIGALVFYGIAFLSLMRQLNKS